MSDALLRALATRAGVETMWRDQAGNGHETSIDTLRSILTTIGLPCHSDDDVRNSSALVDLGAAAGASTHFLTARVGQAVVLPVSSTTTHPIEIELQTGAVRTATALNIGEGVLTLPAFAEPGYHLIRTADAEYTVATAPARAVDIRDLAATRRVWGIAAQIYSLRGCGDCGIGDLRSVANLARSAATHGADMIAISPVHALFAAEPRHYSPYAPSSRLFYNPVLADPRAALPDELVRSLSEEPILAEARRRLEASRLIDWSESTSLRMAALRALYACVMDDTQAGLPHRHDFERFCVRSPARLRDHAAFETLHAHQLALDSRRWSWSDWPAELRDPANPAVVEFVEAHTSEVKFHMFLQWIAMRSLNECQRVCLESGMRVGLIADLAIGMDSAGSHAWSRRDDVLHGVSIGAPPDYYNSAGQDWGLTGFSPRGLVASGFSPFIETLRASMRFAGGLRIDHVMGMSRLWLVPKGARPTEGAYLDYPAETLFRLIALESWRHRALVIGEDLGTVPDGFRDDLRAQGIAGMRVLRFERDAEGYFAPEFWSPDAVGMTTTHDLVPSAGWWAGSDLPSLNEASDSGAAIRSWDRGLLWSAFERAGVVEGDRPPPDAPDSSVDAAIAFLGRARCCLLIVALEDILGVREQPNVPGTTTEQPNWRHRLDGDAGRLLDGEAALRRLRMLRDAAHDPPADGADTIEHHES